MVRTRSMYKKQKEFNSVEFQSFLKKMVNQNINGLNVRQLHNYNYSVKVPKYNLIQANFCEFCGNYKSDSIPEVHCYCGRLPKGEYHTNLECWKLDKRSFENCQKERIYIDGIGFVRGTDEIPTPRDLYYCENCKTLTKEQLNFFKRKLKSKYRNSQWN